MHMKETPFHRGELKAQQRVGATSVSDWASGFIKPYMPQQHREFFSQLPFLVLAGADSDGHHWVTLMDGPDGFISSPNSKTLSVQAEPDPQDPLADALHQGTDVGMLGIELASRRRNRMSGSIRQTGNGFAINVNQSFGNCPQYINERVWHRQNDNKPGPAHRSERLSADQIARIRAADTMFIGTGQQAEIDHASNGFDASHRGGPAGFVAVTDSGHLRIPDYAGNNFFNTIGNLIENPRIGLVFVDFETGGLLHVSGLALINWEPTDSHDPNAARMIEVTVDSVLDRPKALSLRWAPNEADVRELVVAGKTAETDDIASLLLMPVDGTPLNEFKSGQHLPIELRIPGQSNLVKRSYSLSGPPSERVYRLTVKRDPNGLASRFIHDHLQVGDIIRARAPSGEFTLPADESPVVLASAGVGMTPMLAMFHEAAARNRQQPLWFVYGARNLANHALKQEVEDLASEFANLSTHFAYSKPGDDDVLGSDYHYEGRVTAQTLLDLDAGPEAQYLLCGPAAFLAEVREGLEASGVPSDQIHFETFGPAS